MTVGQLQGSSLLWFLLLGCASHPPLPARAQALNDTGVEALAAGDLEAAGTRLELALEYNPRFVEALCNLGLVELERGNLSRADQLLRRARRINDDIAQPHHGLGVLAERRGLGDAASHHYRAALAVDPGFAPSRLNLARLLFDSHHLHHAKAEFEKLVALAPDLAVAHAGLAETLIQLGRRAEAEAIVSAQAVRFPDSPELQVLVARGELGRGNVTRAVALLEPWTGRSDSAAALAFSWLAIAELARDRPRHAIGAAKRALQLNHQSEVARHAMARALTQLGDPRASEWRATNP